MKRFMNKYVSLFLVVLTLATLFSVFSVPSSAATSYDPDAAVAYAQAHWNDGKGLCAEFVSDCLKAGGFTEVYNVNAKKLGRALQNYGTKIDCTGWSSSACLTAAAFGHKLVKGDIIVWENRSGSKWSGHVAIYSGETDSKGRILVYAHNSAKNKAVIKPGSEAATVYAIHINGSKTPAPTEPAIQTYTYFRFANLKSGKMLNVYYSRSTSGTNVTIFRRDLSSGQDFMLIPHGTMMYNGKTYVKYIIVARCAPSCALNVYGYSARNSANVCIWSKSGHNTQDWILEAVNGGYVIRSANNPCFVLCAAGTGNSANVKLAAYSSGNAYQIWKLS